MLDSLEEEDEDEPQSEYPPQILLSPTKQTTETTASFKEMLSITPDASSTVEIYTQQLVLLVNLVTSQTSCCLYPSSKRSGFEMFKNDRKQRKFQVSL